MRRFDWRPLVVPLSIGGYINGIVWLVVGFTLYDWSFPGIDVYTVFTPAGQDFLVDQRPYGGLFFYGPPWAPIMGVFALGPDWLLHATIIVLDVVALWVIAGRSWIGVGYLLWFPLVMSEMAAGQLNILCAGAMVEAQRGRVWPLALMAWAKLWPALALPIRSWRSFLIAGLAIGAIALPWPHLFPDWIAALIGNCRTRRRRSCRSRSCCGCRSRWCSSPCSDRGAGRWARSWPARTCTGASSSWSSRRSRCGSSRTAAARQRGGG